MAALQRIRQHSVALLVIVGGAMVAFIVGDLIQSSSSIMQSSRDKVVTINGKKVTYEDYEAARQRKQDFYKAMQGKELDNQATQQLNNQVYNEFITENLINAAIVARAKGMKIILLTGKTGGALKALADVSIIVPENTTYKIQERHLPIYHTLCMELEDRFF